jgi:hypothetical protein
MGKGSRKRGGWVVLSYYYYYYYYYYLPFLNSLRLGNSRVSRLKKWQMHRPHVQQTLSVSKFGRRRRGLGVGDALYIHKNYYYTPQSPKYK